MKTLQDIIVKSSVTGNSSVPLGKIKVCILHVHVSGPSIHAFAISLFCGLFDPSPCTTMLCMYICMHVTSMTR